MVSVIVILALRFTRLFTIGDIVYVHVFGKPIIILGSHAVCTDLLEKRSSIYSDRPPVPMTGDLLVSSKPDDARFSENFKNWNELGNALDEIHTTLAGAASTFSSVLQRERRETLLQGPGGMCTELPPATDQRP